MTGDALLGAADLSVNDDAAVGDVVTIGDDLDVGGTITGDFSTVSNIDVMQLLAMGLSTSVISGGEFTLNVDPTKLDISATTGYVVTYNSSAPLSATNPNLVFVSVAAQAAITPAHSPVCFYLYDSVGALVQQSTVPTPTQRRTHLFLGVTATVGGVIIVDQTLPVIPSQLNNQLVDLIGGLGPFSTAGNLLSANGVNLTFNKTSGNIFSRAFSQVPTPQDPHNAALAAQTPVQFRSITANPAFFGPLTSILDVANYDPNGSGVITPVGGGANTSTNFRVIGFANNTVTEQILVQYGQNTYPLANAACAGSAGTFVPNEARRLARTARLDLRHPRRHRPVNPAQATSQKARSSDAPRSIELASQRGTHSLVRVGGETVNYLGQEPS
jgi:hypothetical protein